MHPDEPGAKFLQRTTLGGYIGAAVCGTNDGDEFQIRLRKFIADCDPIMSYR